MAFREVSVVQVKEALRRWLKGEGERPIARAVGIDRKTARRYILAAIELGLDRSGGTDQLSDELIGAVLEQVRPHRIDGHGEAWRILLAEETQITAWVKQDITVVKIGILLARRGVVVPHRTLARFAVERCGAGRRTVTVRVADPPPGIELQVDFGRLGLIADGERRRVCQGLIFTACFSRHLFVWPTFSQTTEEVIKGFEAAWWYFGGVFPVVIPDNMKSIVIEAEHTAPRFNDTFIEYAQSRGFVIDAARVRTPTDKGLSSHCTSFVVCGTCLDCVPALWRAADPFGRPNWRDQVVVGAIVVRDLADDQAVVVPTFDGLSAHAEGRRGVLDAEQAARCEAIWPWGKLVGHPDVMDHAGVERLAGAGQDPGVAEDRGDARFGVVIEEPINLGHDSSGRASGVWSRERERNREGRGCPAIEAHVGRDLLAA